MSYNRTIRENSVAQILMDVLHPFVFQSCVDILKTINHQKYWPDRSYIGSLLIDFEKCDLIEKQKYRHTFGYRLK